MSQREFVRFAHIDELQWRIAAADLARQFARFDRANSGQLLAAAKALRVRRYRDRWMLTAHGAVAATHEAQLLEAQFKRIVRQQPPDQRFTQIQQQLDRLSGCK